MVVDVVAEDAEGHVTEVVEEEAVGEASDDAGEVDAVVEDEA